MDDEAVLESPTHGLMPRVLVDCCQLLVSPCMRSEQHRNASFVAPITNRNLSRPHYGRGQNRTAVLMRVLQRRQRMSYLGLLQRFRTNLVRCREEFAGFSIMHGYPQIQFEPKKGVIASIIHRQSPLHVAIGFDHHITPIIHKFRTPRMGLDPRLKILPSPIEGPKILNEAPTILGTFHMISLPDIQWIERRLNICPHHRTPTGRGYP